MSIRVYIVTYKRNDVLNKNLSTLWDSADQPEKLEVTVLANHPDVRIDPKNQRPNLTVKLNETRPTNAWGYLSRDWNFGLLDAFGTWQNPRGTEWCVLAQNDVEWVDGWDSFLRSEIRFDMITQARGDQAIALNIDAVKKVGFFDERFTTLHFQEFDYFLRSIIALVDRVSINDDHPSTREGEICHSSWNPIGQVLTKLAWQGISDDDNLHTPKTWHELHNLLLDKWNIQDLSVLTDKQRFADHACHHPMQPREVDWYPFFWDKMLQRPHVLLDQYRPAQAHQHQPQECLPFLKKLRRKIGRSIFQRCDGLLQWATREPQPVPGPRPVIDHPLNRPPITSGGPSERSFRGNRIEAIAASSERKSTLVRPKSNANRILAVVQGPFFRRIGHASTYEVLERLQSTQYGSRVSVAVAVWANESKGDIRQIERMVDHVHVLPTPTRKGTCHRNWQSYAVNSVLEAHKNDGFSHALKTRSDLLLSDKFIHHIFDLTHRNSDQLCVTNLFTRLEPFHVSDMLVFSRYENLHKFYGNYELYYEDIYSPEVEFTRGYIRARGLEYYHTLEDYLRFLKDHLDLVDYEEMGIVWLKHMHMTPTFSRGLRPYILDRDGGPWQAQLLTTHFHRRLQNMSPRQIRRLALAVNVIDPILRHILVRHPYLRQSPYFVDPCRFESMRVLSKTKQDLPEVPETATELGLGKKTLSAA